MSRICLQISEYVRNIEKITFWAYERRKFHIAKKELLTQIESLRISISGKGFFAVDRPFLAGVSLCHKKIFDKFVYIANIHVTDGSHLLYLCGYIHRILYHQRNYQLSAHTR